MHASFFTKDDKVKIVGGGDVDGVLTDFTETLSPGESFLGLAYEDFRKLGTGSIDCDPGTQTAQFIGFAPPAGLCGKHL